MTERRIPRLPRREFLKLGGAAAIGTAFAGLSAACGGPKKPLTADVPNALGFVLEDLEDLIPPLMAENHVPGVALTVLRAGEVTASRGFGVRERGREDPVTPETLFEAASLGKPVFAYAVMKLVQEGKLDLDRPLVEYDPEPFAYSITKLMPAAGDRSDPRLRAITPRMILSHQSGFPNWSFGKPLQLVRDPGTGFGYSGEGYVYLQGIVEKIASEPIDVFMKKRLLAPLGMKSSSYVWEKGFEKRVASAHDESGVPDPGRRQDQANVASSLYTTAVDYAGFLLAVLDPVASDAVHLDRRLTDEMFLPAARLEDGLSWGLGWGLEETRDGLQFWHWGDNGEYKSFVMVNREAGSGVVVFTNATRGLNVCAPIVRKVLGEDHPALAFKMLQY